LGGGPARRACVPCTTRFRSLTALLGRSNDEGLLDDARRRVAALRGVAAVSDHAELGALLDALDTGLRGVNVPLAGSTHATLSNRSEEHTSELQSREKLVCRL